MRCSNGEPPGVLGPDPMPCTTIGRRVDPRAAVKGICTPKASGPAPCRNTYRPRAVSRCWIDGGAGPLLVSHFDPTGVVTRHNTGITHSMGRTSARHGDRQRCYKRDDSSKKRVSPQYCRHTLMHGRFPPVFHWPRICMSLFGKSITPIVLVHNEFVSSSTRMCTRG